MPARHGVSEVASKWPTQMNKIPRLDVATLLLFVSITVAGCGPPPIEVTTRTGATFAVDGAKIEPCVAMNVSHDGAFMRFNLSCGKIFGLLLVDQKNWREPRTVTWNELSSISFKEACHDECAHTSAIHASVEWADHRVTEELIANSSIDATYKSTGIDLEGQIQSSDISSVEISRIKNSGSIELSQIKSIRVLK
jgi:hypothetical protein